MRTLVFILLLAGRSMLLQAQYVVISVKESVYANEQLIKKKDKINVNAKLRFSSKEAHVYVMSPGKGYFILGVKDPKKREGEFVVALKDALMPPNDYYVAATRAMDWDKPIHFEDQYDLKAFFRNELFFIAPANFKVSDTNFPLDSNHFFVIRHQFKDGWLTKALPYVGQTFEISSQVLQLQSTTFLENAVEHSELYYVNQEIGEELYIGQFRLRFPDAGSIKEDLSTLYKATNKMPARQFLQEHALPYLYLQYGRTQVQAIEQVVEQIQKK